jgi:hypothetical protein
MNIHSKVPSTHSDFWAGQPVKLQLRISVDFTHFLYTIDDGATLPSIPGLLASSTDRLTVDKMGFLRVCRVRDPPCHACHHHHMHALRAGRLVVVGVARCTNTLKDSIGGADVQWSTHLQILELIFYPSILTWFDENSRKIYFPVKARINTYGSYQSLPWGTSRELTGAIKNHSCAVSHRNYFAWRKWGISEEQEWFSPRFTLEFRCVQYKILLLVFKCRGGSRSMIQPKEKCCQFSYNCWLLNGKSLIFKMAARRPQNRSNHENQ